MSRPLSSKMGRFAVVGVANTLIDIAAFAVLFALSVPALAANVGSWSIAVAFSYAVNSR